MKCQEFIQPMFEFRCGELGPHEMALHRAHLAGCEQCQQELRDTEACFLMVKACCRTKQMPKGLEKKLRELIAGGHDPGDLR
jgi:hypothetical protein